MVRDPLVEVDPCPQGERSEVSMWKPWPSRCPPSSSLGASAYQ